MLRIFVPLCCIGSGKSLFLRTLAGQSKVDNAEVISENGRLLTRQELRHHASYVSSHTALLPTLTVRETLQVCTVTLRYNDHRLFLEKGLIHGVIITVNILIDYTHLTLMWFTSYFRNRYECMLYLLWQQFNTIKNIKIPLAFWDARIEIYN